MKYLLFICSGLLFLAVAELPYGYYTFLRIVVTIGAILVVYREYSNHLNLWVNSFGFIAIIFNPVIPVHLNDKQLWTAVDVTCAIIFMTKGLRTKT
ncbi:DUF6804 family protein [Imperialibacter sp.]|uniref:DUF6804 family protein n=1 Tax=Imperialibacter sp. TaxID=2038411 RepID=UPI0032EE1626